MHAWHPSTGKEKAGGQTSKLSQLRSEFKDSVDYYIRLQKEGNRERGRQEGGNEKRKKGRGKEEEPLKMPSAECVVRLTAPGLSLKVKWGIYSQNSGGRRWLWWEG